MNEEKWHQKLLWLLIGAMVTVIVTIVLTPVLIDIGNEVSLLWLGITHTTTPAAHPTNTATIPHLKPYYNGTYIGISEDVKGNHGNVVFTVQSQDSKGNVASTLRYNNSSEIDSCAGNITGDRHITLTCHDGSLPIEFKGLIYSDGHIEAIETYTTGGTAYKNILS